MAQTSTTPAPTGAGTLRSMPIPLPLQLGAFVETPFLHAVLSITVLSVTRSGHHTRAATGGGLCLHRVAQRALRRDRERTGRAALQPRK